MVFKPCVLFSPPRRSLGGIDDMVLLVNMSGDYEVLKYAPTIISPIHENKKYEPNSKFKLHY